MTCGRANQESVSSWTKNGGQTWHRSTQPRRCLGLRLPMRADEAREGLIVHSAGPGEQGYYIYDIWGSREAFMEEKARLDARRGHGRPTARRRALQYFPIDARRHQIAFAPFFPLGSGLAGGPGRLASDAAIVQAADKHGATTAQVSLAWLLTRYDRMLHLERLCLFQTFALPRSMTGDPARARSEGRGKRVSCTLGRSSARENSRVARRRPGNGLQ